ncbi:MAG: class I SAM-dependent methyltransferase [Acidobacteria bacterium]|nr:class I SAM-dependent methyltransferase [Acidobacteriota bacterium]
MNWKWKARVQNAVAMMPLSDQIYYAMQRNVGSFRPGRSNHLEWFEAALTFVKWIKGAGQEVKGRSFLEVGTGHYLSVPMALWLCGASEVVTVDLNKYLADALVAETIEFVRNNQDEVVTAFGSEAEEPLFQERLQQLIKIQGGASELLRLANIKYISPADAARLDFPDESFDFHISHAVFEHIPPDVIAAILTEARRLLKPQGLLVHVIDPSDHFAHDDTSITAINFLQFSEREWKRWAGNKYMYHNRLRAFEYVQLFEGAGVRILRLSEAIDEPSLNVLRNGFELDERFQPIVVEKLAVTGLILMGTFSPEE